MERDGLSQTFSAECSGHGRSPHAWWTELRPTCLLAKRAGVPDTSGIEHIVVLMIKNRSFDHMLGWLDGADGRQRGLRYADK
jgi:phospholipase C